MPIYKCVEPANRSLLDNYIQKVDPECTIFFPAVNSCFAICFIMATGDLIGGHVPMWWSALHFDKNQDETSAMSQSLNKIVKEMQGMTGPAAISLLITMGDQEWWPLMNAHLASLSNPPRIRYTKPGGTRYMTVDGTAQTITVENGTALARVAVAAATQPFVSAARANPCNINV